MAIPSQLNHITARRMIGSQYHNKKEIVTDAPDVRGLDRFAAVPQRAFVENNAAVRKAAAQSAKA